MRQKRSSDSPTWLTSSSSSSAAFFTVASLLCLLLLASDVTEAGRKGKCGGKWNIHACQGGNGKRNSVPVKSALDAGEKRDAPGRGTDDTLMPFASPTTQRRDYHHVQRQRQFDDRLRQVSDERLNSLWNQGRRRKLAQKLLTTMSHKPTTKLSA